MMAVASEPLLTTEEAQEVVAADNGLSGRLRIPMMVVLGLVIVTVVTLLVLIVVSFVQANSGLDTIFPFLQQKSL